MCLVAFPWPGIYRAPFPICLRWRSSSLRHRIIAAVSGRFAFRHRNRAHRKVATVTFSTVWCPKSLSRGRLFTEPTTPRCQVWSAPKSTFGHGESIAFRLSVDFKLFCFCHSCHSVVNDCCRVPESPEVKPLLCQARLNFGSGHGLAPCAGYSWFRSRLLFSRG